MDKVIKGFVRAVVVLAAIFMVVGCGGKHSMTSAALQMDCGSKADCMTKAGLPGKAEGEPQFYVAPYGVEGQSTRTMLGIPAMIGGGFDADADVIVMKAIREAYPQAGVKNEMPPLPKTGPSAEFVYIEPRAAVLNK